MVDRGENLNVIFVMLDSLRQDHVGFYNRGEGVFHNVPLPQTPNLDRFARESIVFINAYPCGLPTIPVREELMTGYFTLPYRPWAPLKEESITIQQILKWEGYRTALITDTYHLFKPGMNYHKGFDTFVWIRGQEYDNYRSSKPRRRSLDKFIKPIYRERVTQGRTYAELVEKFLANIDDFEKEEDWFAAKVFKEAVDWIRENRDFNGKLFLWVDSFEPHEPWYPPREYIEKYIPQGYDGPLLILPMGGYARDWATDEEIDIVRRLYAAEVEYVDKWFGHFYNGLRDTGILDNSIVIVLADHGHPLADHGKFLKGGDRMYSELMKVPFMTRLPGGEKGGRVIDAIIQFPDITPTVLELLGLQKYAIPMPGKSFADILFGDAKEHRKFAIVGYHQAVDRCIRNKEWSYVERPWGQKDELYNMIKDPKEMRNVIDDHPDVVKELTSVFGADFRPKLRGFRGITTAQLQALYELAYTSTIR